MTSPHSLAARLLAAGFATGAALAATSAVALAGPSVSSDPAFFPSFNPAIRDYVSRCGPRAPLRLSVRAPAGGSVSVAGRRRRGGAFTATVRRRVGQQTVIASREHGRTTRYHVRCLPPGFPLWTSTKSGRTQAAYYLIDPVGSGPSRWVTMVDPQGVPVWWKQTGTATDDAKLLPNGRLAWSRFFPPDIFGVKPVQAFDEYTLTGRHVRVDRTVGSVTDLHDMQYLPHGHRLLITYRPRGGVDLRSQGGRANATVLDGEVQEINRRGRKVWSWNSKDHVDLSERSVSGPLPDPTRLHDGRMAYNLVHLNSVEPHGHELLISMRLTSALYDIDRRTGKVLWKLGGTETPQSLRVVGDTQPAPHFGGQHDARVLRDGTITLHDNGTGRNRPPRLLRFRIDTTTRTATLLEQVADPAVRQSFFAGGTRRMAGGNWVVSWGGTSVIEELTPTGRPVFTLRLPQSYFSYRTFPIPAGVYKTSTLRRAMDIQYRPRRRR
jgi:hypothetical protein